MNFFGVTRSDDRLATPIGHTSEGWPIYVRSLGSAFSLVAECKPGPSRQPCGNSSFNEADPAFQRPDLQIIVSRPLGDGSTLICDNRPPEIGGVPASPNFTEATAINGAINDLGCRFVDGAGNYLGRSGGEACTLFASGDYHFVAAGTALQFCARVDSALEFPPGDTLVTVRFRDRAGATGPPATLVIRVEF